MHMVSDWNLVKINVPQKTWNMFFNFIMLQKKYKYKIACIYLGEWKCGYQNFICVKIRWHQYDWLLDVMIYTIFKKNTSWSYNFFNNNIPWTKIFLLALVTFEFGVGSFLIIWCSSWALDMNSSWHWSHL